MSDKPQHKAFYRKYRSQKFSDLVGQPHVTTSLDNALKNGKISHAYLFAGPRGTGKTSAARIFAYRINNLKKPDDNHLDIIEIDAASNRRIDEIRDLREKVHSAPASGEYKVYIIDEVHMLTTEAFNALLKTLEEPPAHVIFILATTEPHKLPETIISRTQRFNFRPLTSDVVLKQLKKVADAEKIKYDEPALELLAIAADGSMRDGISLLDQFATLAGEQKLSLKTITRQLGMADKSQLDAIILAAGQGDVSALVSIIDSLASQGVNVHQFTSQLVDHLRKSLRGERTSNQSHHPHSVAKLMKVLTHNLGTAKSWAAIEAVLLEYCLGNRDESAAAGLRRPVTKPSIARSPAKADIQKPKPSTPKKGVSKLASNSGSKDELTNVEWDKILSHIKSHHNSLYALLKTARADFSPGVLTLTFRFQFHKRRLDDTKNRKLLGEAIIQTTGYHIDIDTDIDSTQKTQSSPAEETSPVDSVLELLGGEVIKDGS